tara:strand:+ start:1423 stop:1659 length:237 start_codon:yes stop_codon:yes gene_type:complete
MSEIIKEYMWWGTNTGIQKIFFMVPEGEEEQFMKKPMDYYADDEQFTIEDTDVDYDDEPELLRTYHKQEDGTFKELPV